MTSEETLVSQPDVLRRFLAASIKGILYAEQNIDEAVDITLKYAGPESDPGLMKFMLESELKDLRSPITDQHTIGWQDLEQWQALENMLVEYGAMPDIDVSKAFTNDLLPQPSYNFV